jgi:hypothetical protein
MTFRIHITEQPPLGLGLIFGDFLYNLRSALDNLVYQLAVRGAGVPSHYHPRFPILTIRRSGAPRAAANLKGLRREHRQAIKALQPYGGWDNTGFACPLRGQLLREHRQAPGHPPRSAGHEGRHPGHASRPPRAHRHRHRDRVRVPVYREAAPRRRRDHAHPGGRTSASSSAATRSRASP